MDPLREIWDLLGEEWHIPIKNIINSDGAYI